MDIQSNLKEVRAQLPPQVSLVAVSKFHPNEAILAAYETGQRIFGESKEQELSKKQASLPADIQWHFIGHLQTNKVKYIAPYIAMIHAVDSYKLLAEIDKQAAKCNRVIPCLLEIHIAEEESKYGFSFEACREMLETTPWKELTHVCISGVMGMATNTDDESQITNEFESLHRFFTELKATYFKDCDTFKEISMGMSHDYHVTSLCAPPTIFRFLIHEDLTKYDLSSLKYCTIAGEALNPAVFDTFKKLTGIKLMEGFGQTETTLTVATMPWMEPKPGSMGLPNPQYDVDLIDHEGRSVEAGEQGQIVIRTSKGKPIGLFKEYYRDAERTREAWHDGIYYTGDVAWKDEDGYLWFVGRADDVIKSSGYRIGPFEVESALMTHPAVIECAITGVPDEIRGQVVKATIVLSKDYKARASEELIKELQNHVKKVTAPYKYPRVIEFVEELPKTISGKIRRVEIRENDKK